MSTDIFMLDVVLNRAETHPEEFSGSGGGKWVRILDSYHEYLTDEERAKIGQAIKKARRAKLNEELMKTLAGEDDTLTEVVPIKESFSFNAKDRLQTFPSNNVTLNYPNTSPYGESLVEKIRKIQEEQEMKAMHDYYKQKGETE
jgi:hypothetical protein